jgi:hypothetical protein
MPHPAGEKVLVAPQRVFVGEVRHVLGVVEASLSP